MAVREAPVVTFISKHGVGKMGGGGKKKMKVRYVSAVFPFSRSFPESLK